MTDGTPASIGKYEILRRIGRGGMAEVFIARDPALERLVAVKVILTHLADDLRMAERFRREARVVASLDHPGIVRIHDFDLADGQPYMVMDYLPGGTLADRLASARARGVRLPLGEVASLLDRLAEALDYAHARQVIHRDIKPGNILFDARDAPVLVDFGIARLLGQSSDLTATGVVAGTPAYLSPEQAAGKPVGPNSDQYSLGAVVYEMVCGQPPFPRDSLTEILMAHLASDPPPPTTMNDRLTSASGTAMLRALSKDPASRFPSNSAFARAFREGLADEAPVSHHRPVFAEDAPTVVEEVAEPVSHGVCLPHNLPAQLAPFVGREHEVEELTDLLMNPACRLITLTGPGGIGKTRLALFAAERLAAGDLQHRAAIARFVDGVRFVPLASLGSPGFLAQAVADALELVLVGEADPEEQLLNHLREKDLLLVLDNFEDLLDPIGAHSPLDLIERLLAAAPKVGVLVTSRERLNVRGEWVLEIGELDYPASTPSSSPEAYSAVRLFVQGAQRARPDFVLQAEDHPHVVRICQLVKGTPLGIELAAAWVRLLSCAEIAAEIQDSLDFLETSLRDVPERQRSLRGVFDHSWKHLDETERASLHKLSVFRGGFTRQAAHHIADATLQVLATLADKSMIRRTEGGRFEIHGVLLGYVREKLARHPDEQEAVLNRHSQYFAGLLQQAASDLRGADQQTALTRIQDDLENLRAAWRHALDHGDRPAIEASADALFFFYDLRSMLVEGREVFEEAAARYRELVAEDAGNVGLRRQYARLLAYLASFTWRLGNFDESRCAFEESIAILRSVDARDDLSFALRSAGQLAARQQAFEEAGQLYTESLTLSRASGDEWGAAKTLNLLAYVRLYLNLPEQAQRDGQEALEIARRVGDPALLAESVKGVANIAHTTGDDERARQAYLVCPCPRRSGTAAQRRTC